MAGDADDNACVCLYIDGQFATVCGACPFVGCFMHSRKKTRVSHLACGSIIRLNIAIDTAVVAVRDTVEVDFCMCARESNSL
jgi:hypothetical protein